jgi:prevent-host-death family protein
MPHHTRSRKPTGTSPTEVPADEVRAALGDYLDRSGFRGERIVITRHAKPVAALVSIEDLKRLEALTRPDRAAS